MWQNQLLNIIIANGYEEFIDIFVPPLKQILDDAKHLLNPEYTEWRKIGQLIMRWLYATLTTDPITMIIGAHSNHFMGTTQQSII